MKNKKGLLAVALLLMVGLSSSAVSGTYAKYIGEVEKSGTMTVAKWAFEDDNTASNMAINFAETYDKTTLVGGKIAPGTSGSFAINVVNKNSETGVEFAVKIGEITGAPTNLKFYSDEKMTTELTDDGITGTLVANDSVGLEVKIYWKWEYETTDGDAADTADGDAASSLTIPVTISGVQAAPSTSAITNTIN